MSKGIDLEMLWPRRIPIFLLLLLVLGGCRNNRGDLVEAELRTRERELRETKEELDRAKVINDALERELMCRPKQSNGTKDSPKSNGDSAGTSLYVKEIALGTGTGGIDEDRIPGDEALAVVLVPKDEDGTAVKAIGNLTVRVQEISNEGVKTDLSTWDVSSIQLRRSWKTGLFSTGYQVTLPWKKIPTTEKLRVIATFTTPDGKVLETDKDITIRPPRSIPSGPSTLNNPVPTIIDTPVLQAIPPTMIEGPIFTIPRGAELGTPQPGLVFPKNP